MIIGKPKPFIQFTHSKPNDTHVIKNSELVKKTHFTRNITCSTEILFILGNKTFFSRHQIREKYGTVHTKKLLRNILLFVLLNGHGCGCSTKWPQLQILNTTNVLSTLESFSEREKGVGGWTIFAPIKIGSIASCILLVKHKIQYTHIVCMHWLRCRVLSIIWLSFPGLSVFQIIWSVVFLGLRFLNRSEVLEARLDTDRLITAFVCFTALTIIYLFIDEFWSFAFICSWSDAG